MFDKYYFDEIYNRKFENKMVSVPNKLKPLPPNSLKCGRQNLEDITTILHIQQIIITSVSNLKYFFN